MVGLGETYIPAFALALGLGEVAAGWIVTLPLLAGAVIQLASPRAVARLRSLRAFVVLCAVLQAMSLAAFVLIAMGGAAPAAVLYLAATAYWAAGLATGPAWNTWVGTLVPRGVRAKFFARRSQLAQFAVLVGIAGGGIALEAGADRGDLVPTFAVLFAIAAAARLASGGFLASQGEPQPVARFQSTVPIRAWIARLRRSSDGRLLVYLLAVQLAVQVAGPFFTPYMLGELAFSYADYLLVIGTSFLAKMLVLPFVGSLAQRFGALPLLRFAGIGIIPMSSLWIISDSLGFLLIVQVAGGAIWATYELTSFLLLFEHIDESERTSVLTIFNLANAAAIVAGALAGGALLGGLGEGSAGYLAIFALSGGLRLLTVPLLFRIGRIPVGEFAIAMRPIAVRPNAGSINVPIVSSLADEAPSG